MQDEPIRLDGMDDQELRSYCAHYVQSARETVHKRAGEGGLIKPEALLHQLSASFDRLLGALFERAAAGPAPATLVALGGYGRRQLYPYSDIDLLILPRDRDRALAQQVMEAVVYPLWDARVAVGHAVRTVEQTIELARTDLTMCTSLLDARLVAGHESAFFELEAGSYSEFFGAAEVSRFVDALVAEREQRHPRFGETVYLLEPNIKSGSGGLRDLNTSFWAAKARYGIADLNELAPVGAATGRQQAALLEARDFMRRLRLAMHLHTGRAQDRLLFEVQEALAPRLFPHQDEIPGRKKGVEEAAVTPAVERLMHAYYRSARTVVLETEGILQRCAVHSSKPRPDRRHIDEHYWAVGDELSSSAPERFWEEPSELVRVFVVAADHGLKLDRSLKDAIAEAAAGAPGMQLPVNDQAIELWRQLLRDSEGSDESHALEQMHDLGVLSAMIPEFEPCMGRVQHDLYHVYTVDRHTLYVVGLLKALRRGELKEQHPMPTAVMAELAQVETLYLAALLHDVAKPLGSQHATKGARLAAGIAARLGLGADEQAEVVFLVRQHLALQHVSQRRDLADPAVVESAAQLVGDVERLRRLYLLAIADTAMTAPDNLTEWKSSLLNELFVGTYRRLTSGSAALPPETLQQRREQLRESLRPTWGPAADVAVNNLPNELITGQPPEMLAHHVEIALESDRYPDSEVRIGTRQQDDRTTILTVCCRDSPGLLAKITGALLLHRVEVLSAQVYTLYDQEGSKVGEGRAVDIFVVMTEEPTDFRKWLAFSRTLEGALKDDRDLLAAVEQKGRPSGLPQRVLPKVRTKVVVDNEGSELSTIVELHAADVWGLLHAVTHELTDLGLEIGLAKVASQGGEVADIFYVRDARTGDKITNSHRVNEIKSALKTAVKRLNRSRRRKDPTGRIRQVK